MMTFPTEWKVIKFHGSKPPISLPTSLVIPEAPYSGTPSLLSSSDTSPCFSAELAGPIARAQVPERETRRDWRTRCEKNGWKRWPLWWNMVKPPANPCKSQVHMRWILPLVGLIMKLCKCRLVYLGLQYKSNWNNINLPRYPKNAVILASQKDYIPRPSPCQEPAPPIWLRLRRVGDSLLLWWLMIAVFAVDWCWCWYWWGWGWW